MLTNYTVNRLLGDYFPPTGQFLGLHIADPTSAGLGSTELSPVTLPSYARQPVIWSAPLNRAVTNTNLLQWLALPAVTIGYLGVWDALNGGNLLAVLECNDPFQIVQAGASIHLPPASIGVTLGDTVSRPIGLPAAPSGAFGDAPIGDLPIPPSP